MTASHFVITLRYFSFSSSETMVCPEGAEMYKYDKESVDLGSLSISQDDNLENITEALLLPSSGLKSESETTVRLKLTPNSRKSNIFISVVAENAQSINIMVDDESILEQSVRYRQSFNLI